MKRLLGLLVALSAFAHSPDASAFPAFARKYGLRCTACHEAWPALNDFGRAFRDQGYQLGVGKDEPTTAEPGYFPISVRITPHYEYNLQSSQTTDQGKKTLGSGGVATIGIDLLTGGTLGKDVSFLVVPTGFTSSDSVSLESAWVRFDNFLGSSWANLKLGRHEVDLPRSSHRPWNLSSTGYLIYGFHPPGSASVYDIGENQRGVEWVGHDRGSMNRIAVSVFSVEGSPGSANALDTPGAYFHATHERQFESGFVSALRVGVFAADATWPAAFLTLAGEPIAGTGSALKHTTRAGGEAHLWLGPASTPFHLIVAAAHGQDDAALFTGAARDGTFDGGFLEVAWTPDLKATAFGRMDLVKNSRQPLAASPRDLGDESALTGGLRYTIAYSNRDEYAVHAECSRLSVRRGADDGSDLVTTTLFLGVDFAY